MNKANIDRGVLREIFHKAKRFSPTDMEKRAVMEKVLLNVKENPMPDLLISR